MTSASSTPSVWLGKKLRWPQFWPPRMKKICTHMALPSVAMAITSASLAAPSALMAWLPWMKVSAFSRSRSTAAVSKSMASAAAVMAPASFFWASCVRPDRKPLASSTSSA